MHKKCCSICLHPLKAFGQSLSPTALWPVKSPRQQTPIHAGYNKAYEAHMGRCSIMTMGRPSSEAMAPDPCGYHTARIASASKPGQTCFSTSPHLCTSLRCWHNTCLSATSVIVHLHKQCPLRHKAGCLQCQLPILLGLKHTLGEGTHQTVGQAVEAL